MMEGRLASSRRFWAAMVRRAEEEVWVWVGRLGEVRGWVEGGGGGG